MEASLTIRDGSEAIAAIILFMAGAALGGTAIPFASFRLLTLVPGDHAQKPPFILVFFITSFVGMFLGGLVGYWLGTRTKSKTFVAGLVRRLESTLMKRRTP